MVRLIQLEPMLKGLLESWEKDVGDLEAEDLEDDSKWKKEFIEGINESISTSDN